MPKSKIEQWLADNRSNTSSDYAELVQRMMSGERIECLVETGEGSTLAVAEYVKTGFGQLFKLTLGKHAEPRFYSVDRDFINACSTGNVLFIKQDFVEAIIKRLELAKNAANFKAIVVPLNTLEDVEALWALMNKTEPSH
jgi:hypothetical protein